MSTWTADDSSFRRSDGATVIEVGICLFEARDPTGIPLVNKKGTTRTWSTAARAKKQLDEEIPVHEEASAHEETSVHEEVPVREKVSVHKEVPVHEEVPETKTAAQDYNPDNLVPPLFMDCGHIVSWLRDGVCAACQMKAAPNWTRLAGSYLRPLPISLRRTRDRADVHGFQGYCCDERGYYIGGLYNDCRRTSMGRCVVHIEDQEGHK